MRFISYVSSEQLRITNIKISWIDFYLNSFDKYWLTTENIVDEDVWEWQHNLSWLMITAGWVELYTVDRISESGDTSMMSPQHDVTPTNISELVMIAQYCTVQISSLCFEVIRY
jgi:hypothetical protein